MGETMVFVIQMGIPIWLFSFLSFCIVAILISRSDEVITWGQLLTMRLAGICPILNLIVAIVGFALLIDNSGILKEAAIDRRTGKKKND